MTISVPPRSHLTTKDRQVIRHMFSHGITHGKSGRTTYALVRTGQHDANEWRFTATRNERDTCGRLRPETHCAFVTIHP